MDTLPILDCRECDWEMRAHGVVLTGENFFVILPDPTQNLSKLCRAIGCSESDMPEKLGRWGIHALNDVLGKDNSEKLLKLNREGEAIYFIEQIHLEHNRPPKLRRYLVYCEVRGIISSHDLLEDAKSSYFSYLENFRRARMFLMVGIYSWEAHRWTRLRTIY